MFVHHSLVKDEGLDTFLRIIVYRTYLWRVRGRSKFLKIRFRRVGFEFKKSSRLKWNRTVIYSVPRKII